MVATGAVKAMRLDNIRFMTVDTTISRKGRSVTITQSFLLPQYQKNVTRPNSAIHFIHGYVVQDPVAMPADLSKTFIISPINLDIIYAMVAPGFDQNRAILDPDKLYLAVGKRYS